MERENGGGGGGGAPRLWRDGGAARVSTGAAVAFAGGLFVAAARGTASAPGCARVGAACGALAAPFFALREVVAAGAGVDGPMASAIAGGFAGYFGALVLAGPRWQAVSQGAVAVGVGCGLADALVQGLDWRRKLFLLNRADGAAVAKEAATQNAAAGAAAPREDARGGVRSLRSMALPSGTVMTEIPGEGPVKGGRFAGSGAGWFKWPAWFPVMKDIDEEYQELIRRRAATILALEEEQARIAALLEELEMVKARSRNQLDAELGESHKPLLPRTVARSASSSA